MEQPETSERDEEIEREIEDSLSCPCVSDLKEGPCGEAFVISFSCYLRNNRDGQELENCVEAFNQLQECMIQHPEQFADFVEPKPSSNLSQDKTKSTTSGAKVVEKEGKKEKS